MDIFKQLGDSPIRGMCLGIFCAFELLYVWLGIFGFCVV